MRRHQCKESVIWITLRAGSLTGLMQAEQQMHHPAASPPWPHPAAQETSRAYCRALPTVPDHCTLLRHRHPRPAHPAEALGLPESLMHVLRLPLTTPPPSFLGMSQSMTLMGRRSFAQSLLLSMRPHPAGIQTRCESPVMTSMHGIWARCDDKRPEVSKLRFTRLLGSHDAVIF